MLDKIQVPLGKPVATKVSGSSLLYNEYIVYDVAQVIPLSKRSTFRYIHKFDLIYFRFQVNIKYLVKTKFHYK